MTLSYNNIMLSYYNIMKLYFIDWIGAWRLADFKITIRGATYDWGQVIIGLG